MDKEKLKALLRAKYLAYQAAQQQAQLILAQLQGAAEAADLKAGEVNEILGVTLFSDVEEKKEGIK